MEHTKTPWHVKHGRFIESNDGSLASIAIVPVNAMSPITCKGYANAAFIVKAVNNHERLLGALINLVHSFPIDHPSEWLAPQIQEVLNAIRVSTEVIEQAEEE